MSELKLTILGSGSALPRGDAFHTSQVLEMRNKQFMIDCGEGAQIRMRQNCVHTARLNHIFISHLHGDHCFGLIGLISTLGMLGRTADITIHSHPDLEGLLAPQVKYFCSEFPFDVKFEPFTPYKSEVIYDDRSVKVTTLPLKHRVPSSGFLFEEKPTERHLVKKMLDAYEVPMVQYRAIKAGADFVTTTLTISPLKNAPLLNAIGEQMAVEAGVTWLPSDFKKKNGYKRSVELSAEHELYRQDYCGCVFSKMEREQEIS